MLEPPPPQSEHRSSRRGGGETCALSPPCSRGEISGFRFNYQTATHPPATHPVIARSHRVSPSASPMTGSATKQSRMFPRTHSGLLRFARNDAETHLRIPATHRARVLPLATSLEKQRAQGRPGAWPTPMAPVREKMHGAGTTGLAEIHPAFPARMVLTAYSALSPVRPGFVVTVTRGTQMRPCGFSTSIGAPGPRGLTVRHIVSRLAQKRLTLRRPSHPASTFVTTRTPLLRSGMRGVAIEWVGL